MAERATSSFVKRGEVLTPGVNVDRVDIAAGLRFARQIGYADDKCLMVLQYALQLHSRAEESLAEKTALGHGIRLTQWRMVLAAAVVAAQGGESRG